MLADASRYYWRYDEIEKAIAILEHGYERNPDDGRVVKVLAQAYQKIDDPRALATARRAYQLLGDDVEVQHLYGWLLSNDGEPRRGLALLDKVAESAAATPALHYHRAATLATLGENYQARAALRLALGDDQAFTERAAAEQDDTGVGR